MKWQKRHTQARSVKEFGLISAEKRYSTNFLHSNSKQSMKTPLCSVTIFSCFVIFLMFILSIPGSLRFYPVFSTNGGNLPPYNLVANETIETNAIGRWFSSWSAPNLQINRNSSLLPAKNETKRSSKKKYTPYLELDDDLPSDGRYALNGTDSCDPKYALIRLYMYELGGEFNFGILNDEYVSRMPHNISDFPRYRGGLHLQHSPEYWLTIDLITSRMKDRTWPCTAVRVFDPAEADLIWVPFFASMAYNRYTGEARNFSGERAEQNLFLQVKVAEFLQQHSLWKKSNGQDHVIVVHHPNSMHATREQLSTAILVLADFGRYNASVANLDKDVIAPYKHMVATFTEDQNGYWARTTLLFFQGMIVRKDGGIIRQRLYDILHNEEGVHFTGGNTQREGIRSATSGMRNSRFCLHLAGDTPSSNRLFDAIASHCVPVIISDELELPFEDTLDYSKFCIFVPRNNSLIPGHVISLLRGVQEEEWTAMWQTLKEVSIHFEYDYPTRPNDATSMVWRALAKKKMGMKVRIDKQRRYQRSNHALLERSSDGVR